MRIIKTTLLLILVVSCNGNSSQSQLSDSKRKEITNYFEANRVFLKVDRNVYSLIVEDSNISNPYLLEQFSKVAALSLYQILVKRKPEIEYSTEFRVVHRRENPKTFSYKLDFLAEIVFGISSIEKAVNSLKEENKVLLDLFYIDSDCNEKPIIAKDIDWMKIQNMELISFESAEFNLCEDTITNTLFRMNLHPLNKIILVYYNLEDDKIIAIVPNQK